MKGRLTAGKILELMTTSERTKGGHVAHKPLPVQNVSMVKIRRSTGESDSCTIALGACRLVKCGPLGH